MALFAVLAPLAMFHGLARPFLNNLIWSCNAYSASHSDCLKEAQLPELVTRLSILEISSDLSARYFFGISSILLSVVILIVFVAAIWGIIHTANRWGAIGLLAISLFISLLILCGDFAGSNTVRGFLVDEIFKRGDHLIESIQASGLREKYVEISENLETIGLISAIFLFSGFAAIASPMQSPNTKAADRQLRARVQWIRILLFVGVALFVLVVVSTRAFLSTPAFLLTAQASEAVGPLITAVSGYWASVSALALALAFSVAVISLKHDISRYADIRLGVVKDADKRKWVSEHGLEISGRQLAAQGFAILLPIISNLSFDLATLDISALLAL